MVLFLSIDLLVVNRLLGPEFGGRYAAVLQWSTLLRTAGGVIGGLFGPTILYYYARGDIAGLVRYSRRATKLMAIAMSLLIGGICGFAYPLLVIWLGDGFADLNKLMALMTCHLAVNLAVTPLFGIQTATNRVVTPGFVMIASGFANLFLAFILAGPMNWGMYGVASAGAIVLSAKNFAFTPVYNAYILGQPWHTFLADTILAVFLTAFVAIACMSLSFLLPMASWKALLLGGAAVSVAYSLLVYCVVLTQNERTDLLNLLTVWTKAGER